MKKEKVILNIGENFSPKASIINDYLSGYFKEFKTLNQCYNNCSYAKEKIYDYYYDLLLKNSDIILDYGIRSYNSMIIVLHAIIIKDNKKYYLLITPSYNWYCEIKEGVENE